MKEFQNVPKLTRYDEKQRRDILSEVMDSEKIQLLCGRHSYLAGEKPPTSTGCKECWQAWYMHKIATTPPHLRQERLEMMERMIHDAVKDVEAGRWDFSPLDHPEVDFSKEPD